MELSANQFVLPNSLPSSAAKQWENYTIGTLLSSQWSQQAANLASNKHSSPFSNSPLRPMGHHPFNLFPKAQLNFLIAATPNGQRSPEVNEDGAAD